MGEPIRVRKVQGRTIRAEKGVQTDTGNGRRGRHTKQEIESENGGAKLAGLGDIHVDGFSLQERTGRAGATEIGDTTTNSY